MMMKCRSMVIFGVSTFFDIYAHRQGELGGGGLKSRKEIEFIKGAVNFFEIDLKLT